MREIVVLSGKGGTGKTSITAAFASLANMPVVVDCDVDAADLHLVLQPEVREDHEFIGGKVARVDADACTQCGKCAEVCRFGAILVDNSGCYRVDQTACEGCGVCSVFCPSGAIVMDDSLDGHWFISRTRVGPMVHARLRAGGENSGKLVALIRKEARDIAESTGAGLILTDGPPGIGCPVIASLSGASRVVIVTEPTVSGIHDMERVIGLTEHFKVPASVIINKSDINTDKADQIDRFAAMRGFPVLGRIPYDPVVTAAQLVGKTIIEYSDGLVSCKLREIWDEMSQDN